MGEIHVALSDPPKKATGPVVPSDVKSLGGTVTKDFGPRGKGRSQLAFTPRSITVPPKTATNLQPMKFVKSTELDAQTDVNVDGNGVKASKSNADFRNMVLNK